MDATLHSHSMDQVSEERSGPVPDAGDETTTDLVGHLNEALAIENLHTPSKQLFEANRKPWEVQLTTRDEAAQTLRFLRAWFDLPQTVYFASLLYMDQFICKMKIGGKYFKCLTVSCFHIAASQEQLKPDKVQLVKNTKSTCSVQDMLRMSDIVKDKLNLNDSEQHIVTSKHFLDIFLDILEYLVKKWDVEVLLTGLLSRDVLVNRLAIVMSNHSCCFFRPSTLALALVKTELDQSAKRSPDKCGILVMDFLKCYAVINKLQQTCQIESEEFIECCTSISKVLTDYDNEVKKRKFREIAFRSLFNYSYYPALSTITESPGFWM